MQPLVLHNQDIEVKIVDLHDKLVLVVELCMQLHNQDNLTYTKYSKSIVGHDKPVHNQDNLNYTKD